MKEFKFVMAEDVDNRVVCISHSPEEVENNIKIAAAALREFVNANCRETFEGVAYVQCEFYFDDEGAANYAGPDADHPYYDQDRFMEAMEKFTADTIDERGRAAPDEAWINVGGTYCCGPTWKANPYYTGAEVPHPDETVH